MRPWLSWAAQAAGSPQLSDKAFGSLSGLWTERDGYARSLTTGEVFNDDDRTALRGALRFLAADNVVIDLTADYTDEQVWGIDDAGIDWEALVDALSRRVDHLMRHDFEGLMTAMYQIDVSEQRFTEAVERPPGEQPARAVAELILERELEKMESRKRYLYRILDEFLIQLFRGL